MQIFRKKTLVRVLGESGKKSLRPTLRTLDLIFLGIGSVIGSGILVLTGEVASKSGPSVIFSFLIAGLACGLTALCYAELSSMIPYHQVEVFIHIVILHWVRLLLIVWDGF